MVNFLCMLCLEENRNLIEVTSIEGIQLQISAILYAHFPVYFEEAPRNGSICRNCWTKVEPFHEFYLIVEAIHKSCHENGNSLPTFDSSFLLKDETYPPEASVIKEDEAKSAENYFNLDKKGQESPYYSLSEASTLQSNNNKTEPTSKRRRASAKKVAKDKRTRKKPKNVQPLRRFSYEADESGVYRCDQCNLPFLSPWKLYKHIKETHETLAFKCKETRCVESYATQIELDHHVSEKHIRIKCPLCNIQVNANGLQTHIEESHNREKEVLCDLCGLVCKNGSVLHWHRTSMHETETRLQCDICLDWAKNKQSMRQHMRRKHINGPATCTICLKQFKGRHVLHSHMKLHFVEQREKHKCNFCGRGFPSSTKRREHEAIHSGQDLYECKNCGKTFRFSSSMSLHRKKCYS